MTADLDWTKLRREAIDVRPAKPKRERKSIDWSNWFDEESVPIVLSILFIGLLYLNACFAEWGWPHVG